MSKVSLKKLGGLMERHSELVFYAVLSALIIIAIVGITKSGSGDTKRVGDDTKVGLKKGSQSNTENQTGEQTQNNDSTANSPGGLSGNNNSSSSGNPNNSTNQSTSGSGNVGTSPSPAPEASPPPAPTPPAPITGWSISQTVDRCSPSSAGDRMRCYPGQVATWVINLVGGVTIKSYNTPTPSPLNVSTQKISPTSLLLYVNSSQKLGEPFRVDVYIEVNELADPQTGYTFAWFKYDCGSGGFTNGCAPL